MAALETVLTDLDALDSKALAKVQAKLNALRATGGAKGVTTQDALDAPELFVLGAVEAFSKSRAIDVTGMHQLRRLNNFGAFREKVPDLMTFLSKQKLQRNEMKLLLRLGIELLYEDITRWQKVAASSRTLMDQIHRLPSLFDAHFPGYARAGYLGLVVKRRVKGLNEE